MTSAIVKRAASVFALVVLLDACKGGSAKTADPDASADNSVTGSQGSTVDGIAGAGLSDANIFHLLDAANRADSIKGALAVTKGTSAEVREFANLMVRDHHRLRKQGEDLAKRLVIQPVPPPNDPQSAKLDDALSKLGAAAKGRDFDKAYIDHEVSAHREVLTIATSAMNTTRNSEIKFLIQKAAPVIQAHFDRAVAIQKDLQK